MALSCVMRIATACNRLRQAATATAHGPLAAPYGGWASIGVIQTYVSSADRIKRDVVERLPF